MALYRCPKHDTLFEARTDQRPPNSKEMLPAGCHPDCPLASSEKAASTAQAGQSRVIG